MSHEQKKNARDSEITMKYKTCFSTCATWEGLLLHTIHIRIMEDLKY